MLYPRSLNDIDLNKFTEPEKYKRGDRVRFQHLDKDTLDTIATIDVIGTYTYMLQGVNKTYLVTKDRVKGLF